MDVDHLIAKFFAGEALPDEAMQLEDWLNTSPENNNYFEECRKIFRFPAIHQSDSVWNNIRDSFNKKRETRKKILWLVVGIAASIALLAGVVTIFNVHTSALPQNEYYLAQFDRRKVKLSDGSSVVLEKNSSIEIGKTFGKENRDITLKGSAFFSVRHDPKLPLIIHISKLQILDVGTRFNIITSGDTITVLVQDGSVLVSDDFGAKRQLVAGDKARYVQLTHRLIVNKAAQRRNKGPVIQSKTVPQSLDTVFGHLLLQCSQCTGVGKLIFRSVRDHQRTDKRVVFEKNTIGGIYRYIEQLPPGEYLWNYFDDNKMTDHGKIAIKAGQQIHINLFELQQ